jgi:MGT family glycosyltransferase
MSDGLLVTWPGGGNVNPMLHLGAALRDAGHGVRVLGPAGGAGTPESAGLGAPCRAAGLDLVSGAAAGPWDLAAEAADVADELRRRPTDFVIVDYMMPGAWCAAERSGLPTVALVHTLWTDMALSPHSPMMMAADLAAVNGLRADLRLPPLPAVTDLFDRADLTLITATAELDGAREPYPAGVHAIGPLVGALAAPVPAPARAPADGTPFVVAGLGTTPMNQEPVLRRLLAALADLPLQALVTVGAHLDPATFDAPAHIDVRRYVPHAEVLPTADLFVSHAGLGGISAALSFGVPLLCLPLGRDQPGNAARIEAIGAGRTLTPDAPVEVLRAAVTALLATDRYASVAKSQAATIRATDPAGRAVTLVEDLLTR